MPFVKVVANKQMDADKVKELSEGISKEVAKVLGKPESYVMAVVEVNPSLILAGSSNPCAYVELKSIGLPEGNTSVFSDAICSYLSANAGVDANRIYIEFANAKGNMWGWNGSTF